MQRIGFVFDAFKSIFKIDIGAQHTLLKLSWVPVFIMNYCQCTDEEKFELSRSSWIQNINSSTKLFVDSRQTFYALWTPYNSDMKIFRRKVCNAAVSVWNVTQFDCEFFTKGDFYTFSHWPLKLMIFTFFYVSPINFAINIYRHSL